MDLGLKDKIAFVAASSRGLGAATARQLARDGAKVVINSRDAARLNATADSIRQETGAQVLAVVGDVNSVTDIERMIGETANHFGALDIVVTNSGGPPVDSTISTTKRGRARRTRYLILSNSIRLAVIGLIKSLALELGNEGIRFNSILPTFTETERVIEL